MNTKLNSTRTEEKRSEATYCPSAYATVFKERLERVAKVSKISLDLAVEENAEILASYKTTMNVRNPLLLDLAGRAFRGYVTFQKSLLDLAFAVDQSTAGVEAIEQEPSLDVDHLKPATMQAPLIPIVVACDTFAAQSSDPECAEKQQSIINAAPLETEADPQQLRKLAKEIVDLALMPAAKPTIQ